MTSHFIWRLIFSLALAIAAAAYFWRPLVPSGEYFLSVLVNSIRFELAFAPPARLPLPRLPTPEEQAVRLLEELKAMSDDRLLLISEADRPCKSGLMRDCYFSDNYTRRLAAAERKARADKREQETKDYANEIARRAAEASELSAKHAGDNAYTNGWIAFGTVFTALATILGLIAKYGRRDSKNSDGQDKTPTDAREAANVTPSEAPKEEPAPQEVATQGQSTTQEASKADTDAPSSPARQTPPGT